MPLLPKEIEQHFTLSLGQYLSIDFKKSEHYAGIVQGLFMFEYRGCKTAMPFHFTDEAGLVEVRKCIAEQPMDMLAICFVQHYIHYEHYV